MRTVLASLLMTMFVSCQHPAGIRQLTPVEFESSMNKAGNGNYVLVDVRTPEEFSEGHLEGAVNIDYNNAGFSENIQKLNKKKLVFVYCRSGGRSASAVSDMQRMGFTSIIELDGGIMAWEDSQLKIVK